MFLLNWHICYIEINMSVIFVKNWKITDKNLFTLLNWYKFTLGINTSTDANLLHLKSF